ncbi:MAG: response regulator [Bacteriovoracaceae bacterium]|nr:response regulator [Bacteriovoracaceae bacterium]
MLDNLNILIIDDDPEIRSYFNKFFKIVNSDIQLFEAESLVQAIDIIENQDIAFILLDLNLEFETGVDFLKFRNSMSDIKKIPVVIISSHTEQKMVKECINNGIKDFIKKPFDSYEQLKDRLKKIPAFASML